MSVGTVCTIYTAFVSAWLVCSLLMMMMMMDGGDDNDNNNNKAQNLVRRGYFKRTHAQYWFVLQ